MLMKYYKDNIMYILRLFEKEKKRLIILGVNLMLISGASFILPFMTKQLIDDGFIKKQVALIVIYSVSILGIYIISSFLSVFKEKQRLIIYNNIKKRLHFESFIKLTKMEFSFFNENNTTGIYQMLEEDITAISSIVSDDTLAAFAAVFTSLGGGLALFYMNWQLAVAVLLYLPIKYLAVEKISKKAIKSSIEYINSNKKYSQWFAETVSAIREIRLFNLEERKIKQFNYHQDQIIKANLDKGINSTLNVQIEGVIERFINTLIYLVAAVLLTKNHISVGEIVAFESYITMVYEPVSSFFNIIYGFNVIQPSIERYQKFMNEAVYEEKGDKPVIYGKIEFKNVSFGYNATSLIIKDLSFKIKQSTFVCIIGKNGIGKSTVLNLISGIYRPNSGTVYIDGVDLTMIDKKYYIDRLSIITSDFYLFDDTIINNILLGLSVEKEILENLINELEMVDLFEKYYNESIGENGNRLSSGQRQKIAIARTIIHKKKIIILDEPNSNLDKGMNLRLVEILKKYLSESTIICVTHSNDIYEKADTVIELS